VKTLFSGGAARDACAISFLRHCSNAGKQGIGLGGDNANYNSASRATGNISIACFSSKMVNAGFGGHLGAIIASYQKHYLAYNRGDKRRRK